MRRESAGRCEGARRSPPLRRPAGDGRGVGGFYEAIMAMMIVTSGVVMLTCSFTFLAIGGEEGSDLHDACEAIMSSVLENRTISPKDRMVDQRQLERADWASVRGEWTGGMAVFLTYPDGSSRMLYQDGEGAGKERCAISEPVNIVEHGGVVSAGLLTTWVRP